MVPWILAIVVAEVAADIKETAWNGVRVLNRSWRPRLLTCLRLPVWKSSEGLGGEDMENRMESHWAVCTIEVEREDTVFRLSVQSTWWPK